MRGLFLRSSAPAALAAAAMLLSTAAGAQESPGTTTAESGADDIVITATKRNEALRDVAGSISAVTEADLQELNAQGLSDYITRVPGVVFNDYQPGVSEVVIRGVASTTYHEANQATTGYYLNQIPLIEPGFPLVIPDVDSFDVRQVEVLRGPQGTLFGSSSLGGAVNYVVNEADPTRLDAGFEGILSSTRRSDAASYAAKAMVNVPVVSDKLAVRLVALQREDAGYLDNIGTGEDGSNDLRVRGLRGSIVWTPRDGTKLSALSMYQRYDLDDQTYALFALPRFQRETSVPEYQDTQFMLHSLRAEQDLGFGTLTALGSYTEKKSGLAFDDSVFLGIDTRTNTAPLSGSTGKSKTDYAELRLASNGDTPFTYVVGGNYTLLRSDSTNFTQVPGIGAFITANPALFPGQTAAGNAPGDQTSRTLSTNRVRELAAFGEIGYTFRDVLTLTLGGRVFEYQTRATIDFLPNVTGVTPITYAPGKQTQSGFIPKVSLRYRPNDRVTAYLLYSEGFRIGGVNVFSAAVPGLPLSFDDDKTKNYEAGVRFDLVPNAMSFDITAYHIDWQDIQARLFVPVTFQAFTTNGGGADIDGVEMTVTLRPTRALTFSSSVTYNDARLSRDLPAFGAAIPAGTQLPGASDWILANRLDLDLGERASGLRLGIAHRYLSAAPVAFGVPLEKGDYHLIDLNAAIRVGRRAEVGVFAKNLFDQYGILNAPFSFAGAVTRPRTVGASLRFSLD